MRSPTEVSLLTQGKKRKTLSSQASEQDAAKREKQEIETTQQPTPATEESTVIDHALLTQPPDLASNVPLAPRHPVTTELTPEPEKPSKKIKDLRNEQLITFLGNQFIHDGSYEQFLEMDVSNNPNVLRAVLNCYLSNSFISFMHSLVEDGEINLRMEIRGRANDEEHDIDIPEEIESRIETTYTVLTYVLLHFQRAPFNYLPPLLHLFVRNDAFLLQYPTFDSAQNMHLSPLAILLAYYDHRTVEEFLHHISTNTDEETQLSILNRMTPNSMSIPMALALGYPENLCLLNRLLAMGLDINSSHQDLLQFAMMNLMLDFSDPYQSIPFQYFIERMPLEKMDLTQPFPDRSQLENEIHFSYLTPLTAAYFLAQVGEHDEIRPQKAVDDELSAYISPTTPVEELLYFPETTLKTEGQKLYRRLLNIISTHMVEFASKHVLQYGTEHLLLELEAFILSYVRLPSLEQLHHLPLPESDPFWRLEEPIADLRARATAVYLNLRGRISPLDNLNPIISAYLTTEEPIRNTVKKYIELREQVSHTVTKPYPPTAEQVYRHPDLPVSFAQFNLSSEGDSLFIAIALQYLIKASYPTPFLNVEARILPFKMAYFNLFGTLDGMETHFELIRRYNGQKDTLNHPDYFILKQLIAITFRQRVVMYMEDHPNSFSNSIEGSSFARHCELMKRPGTPGGTTEINAMAQLLNISIHTYMHEAPLFTSTDDDSRALKECFKIIFVPAELDSPSQECNHFHFTLEQSYLTPEMQAYLSLVERRAQRSVQSVSSSSRADHPLSILASPPAATCPKVHSTAQGQLTLFPPPSRPAAVVYRHPDLSPQLAQFDTLAEGDCLFIAIALQYLIKAANQRNAASSSSRPWPASFQTAYEQLFGNSEKVMAQIRQQYELITHYDGTRETLNQPQYRALKDLICKVFRNRVVDYMKNNQTYFQSWVEEDVPFDTYCDSMRRVRHGGDLEINAISRMLGKPIHVYRHGTKGYYPISPASYDPVHEDYFNLIHVPAAVGSPYGNTHYHFAMKIDELSLDLQAQVEPEQTLCRL